MQVEVVAVNSDRVGITSQVQVPVHGRNKHRSTNDVSERCGNHALPDVVADCDLGVAEENRNGDVKHVRDDVVEAQQHERENRPPDSYDLREELASAAGEETGEAHEPVGADGFEKDLIPGWGNGFGGGNGESFCFVGVGGEDAAVTDDDADDEEGACEVAEKGQSPVHEHLPD